MDNNYFNSRRSVREFTDATIDYSLLTEIIEQAMRAPTTGNMQLYSIITTANPERKRLLAEQHFNQPAAVGAPMILTICADFNRFIKWCDINGAEHGFNNFQSFFSAALDAIIIAQQITTIAEIKGLGTCYLGTVTYNAPKIAELLKLPRLVVPVASLAIGFPKSYPEESERLPINGILFEENYPEMSDSRISEIYSIKENYRPNQKFIKENNKENLAQVFTDIRYPRANNELFSKIFYDFIAAQGFEFPIKEA